MARPRRMTSEDARRLICEWQNDHSDDNLSDISEDSESEQSFGSRSSAESDSESEITGSRPSTSKGKGKRKGPGKGKAVQAKRSRSTTVPTTSAAADYAAAAEEEVPWKEIKEGETHNTFRHAPPRPAGVDPNLVPLDSSPLFCLRSLLTDDVLLSLVEAINKYAEHRCRVNNPPRRRSLFRNWIQITLGELFKFFAVLIAIGIVKKPKISDYWRQSAPYMETPWFRQMFSRDRFQAIYHSMLHVSEVGTEGKAKIEPFLNRLVQQFQRVFYPFTNLSLDEMVIGWKGRWAHKMFNASKPKKYHVKTFGLCDSATGYVIDLLVYFGADTSYSPHLDHDSQQAVKVFDTLLKSCHPGHHLFADRYYTSYPLLQHLSSKGHYFTGTVNINRRDFPKQFKTTKLNHREMKWFVNDFRYLSVMFRDKKAKKSVLMVSSAAKVETRTLQTRSGPVIKPAMVDDYNRSMNGCDRVDQCIGTYGMFNRRTRKWWKKIFYWTLEIAQLNSFVIYTLSSSDEKKLPLLNFKERLIQELSQLCAQQIDPAPTNHGGHVVPTNPVRRVTNASHILVRHPTRYRNCVVCSTPDVRVRTSFYCEGCPGEPHLHPNKCNKKFHSA